MRSTTLTLSLSSILSVLVACSSEHGDLPQKQASFETTAPVAPATVHAIATSTSIDVEVSPRMLRRFQPLPTSLDAQGKPPRSKELVDLGRMLFFEARISRGGDVSCNSCHDLGAYGADGHRTSTGFGGQHGRRNSPSVYNAAGHIAQFWDGRASDVESQALVPLLDSREMAMPDGAQVVKVLGSIPTYVDAFAHAFPEDADAITLDHVGAAIGAFERGLVTPGRWDDFLRGDKNALTLLEKKGLKTFLDVGCMVCHTGSFVGGSMFERVGAVEPWPNQEDRGREELTHASSDRMMFKVPSLRNVAHTAPYFHDGSVATLEEAVKMMGRYQLGVDLAQAEVDAIVAWLRALSGDLPAAYVAAPELPARR